MRGFGSFTAAGHFCAACEAQRQYFRSVATSGERVSLAERRHRFQDCWASVVAELAIA